jgi:hypothetical protein
MNLDYLVVSIVRDSILEDIKAVGFKEYLEALHFVLRNEFDEFMAEDIADEILAEAFLKAISAYKNHGK